MIDAEYEELDDGTGELDLADTDNLPWLESDVDDEDAGGLDMGQILGFAGGLILLLALVVSAVWYVSSRSAGAEAVADGSVIAAPEGPIKERPENPGGKEFAGTGNVAPLVGEGETREAVVAEKTVPVPKPSPRPAPEPSATAAVAPAAAGGVAVQLAAYGTRTRAEQGWSDLSRRTDVLAGVKYRVVEGRVDIGTVFRLQAVAATREEADKLCAALKADGLDCQVK